MLKNISQKVYDYVKAIPEGKVTTYGNISKQLKINSARAVGQIMHNNPSSDNCPCHRVVFADGSLSQAFAFGGQQEQKAILSSEGVTFKNNKVDLARHLFLK